MRGKRAVSSLLLATILLVSPVSVRQSSAAEIRPTDAKPDASGVKKLFGMLLMAVDEETVASTAALIDVDQMLLEVQRQGILPGMSPDQKATFFADQKRRMPEKLYEQGRARRWQRCRLQHAEFNAAGDKALVVVRVFGPEAADGKGPPAELIQFWLISKDDGWWIYDWRDMESVCRASTSTAIELYLGRDCESAEQTRILLAAARAASARDYHTAEDLLRTVEWVVYPSPLKALWWLLAAQVEYGQGDPAATLKCLDKAARHDPDLLADDIMRSAAHNALGNHAKALSFAQETLAELGDDARIYCRVGDALAGLKRSDEAAAAYRKGLECEPNSVENLVGLGNVLPAGQRSEVGDRFVESGDPSGQFAVLADSFVDAGNIEALEALVTRHAKVAPDQMITDYYRCKTLLLKEDYTAAAELIRTLLARVSKDDSPYLLVDEYLDAMLAAKKPLEAYEQAPDLPYAARYLARALFYAEDIDNLVKLAEAHKKRFPNDLAVRGHVGKAHMMQKRYLDAEKVFAECMKKSQGTAISEAFRRYRVEAMFRMGRGLEAFEKSKPKVATFDQLARLFAAGGQAAELRKLIAEHRKTAPNSVPLLMWEAVAARIEGDNAVAARLLESALPRVEDKELRPLLVQGFLDASLLAKRPVEAYQKAPDPKSTFDYLADALASAGDAKNLKQLMELHRKGHPEDLQLEFYGGHLHLLDKQYGQAEKVFADGMAKAEDPAIQEAFRSMRVDARLEMGEWLSAYREIGPHRATYDQLSRHFAAEEEPDPLVELAAAHRKNAPEDPTIGLWEAEVQWLRGNYQKVVDICCGQRESILSDPDNLGRFEDRLIRSLVRIGRLDEAMEEAKVSSARDGDVWFEAVVHAVAGRTAETSESLAVCAGRGYEPADFYDDPELGPALRSTEFAHLRQKYPAPEE